MIPYRHGRGRHTRQCCGYSHVPSAHIYKVMREDRGPLFSPSTIGLHEMMGSSYGKGKESKAIRLENIRVEHLG